MLLSTIFLILLHRFPLFLLIHVLIVEAFDERLAGFCLINLTARLLQELSLYSIGIEVIVEASLSDFLVEYERMIVLKVIIILG